jgi:hypothetical protein
MNYLPVLMGSPNEKIESCLTKRCRLVAELVDISDEQLSWLLTNEPRFSSINDISVSCFDKVFLFCSMYEF